MTSILSRITLENREPLEGMMLSRILAAILFVSVTWLPAAAEVVRIEVQSRADLVAGKPFGAAGPQPAR